MYSAVMGFLALLIAAGCATPAPPPQAPRTHTVWSSRIDPQLQWFPKTSMLCQADAARDLPYPQGYAAPIVYARVDVERAALTGRAAWPQRAMRREKL